MGRKIYYEAYRTAAKAAGMLKGYGESNIVQEIENNLKDQ